MKKIFLLDHYSEWLKHATIWPCRQSHPELYMHRMTSLTLLHHHHRYIIPTSSPVLICCFKTQPRIVSSLHYNYRAPFFQPPFHTMSRMSLNAPKPEKIDSRICGQTTSLTVNKTQYLTSNTKGRRRVPFSSLTFFVASDGLLTWVLLWSCSDRL